MDRLVVLVAKIFCIAARLLGGGTSMPGKFAMHLRPKILHYLTRDCTVILVTGTNGKTTTCAQITSILKAAGCNVVNNGSGANMKSGIVSALIEGFPVFSKRKTKSCAVIETDEAYLQYITSEITPEIIAVTNLFRDQLDRYGEVDKTFKLIKKGCELAPTTTLVLNGDESIFSDFVPNMKKYFFGFRLNPFFEGANELNAEGRYCTSCNKPYIYNFRTFNHLGDFCCESCGKKRPKLSLGVDKVPVLTADCSQVSFDGLEVLIPMPGAYNIYNALCAATVAGAMGVCPDDIKKGIENQGSKFGRQETVMVDEREVRIILVKNPAGCNEAINSVLPDKEKIQFCFLVNDNPADGTDISWLYDAQFEKLAKMDYQHVLVGGIRAYDMGIRLKCAGFDPGRITIADDYDSVLYSIRTNLTGRIYLFTTYTAMTSFRKFLHKKKYISTLWGED